MKTPIMLSGMVTALSIFAAGCGGFKTDDKGAKGDENDINLTGAWDAGCLDADAFKLTHKTNALTFSAIGDFDRVTTLYSGDACATKEVEVAVHGTYDVVGSADNIDGGADNINFTVHKATVTPKSDNAVKLLTTTSYCGLTDWSVDKEVDIAGKECLGEKLDEGQVVFDIYRVENDDKTLLVGDSLNWFDNTDSQDRPTQLAADHPYSKQ